LAAKKAAYDGLLKQESIKKGQRFGQSIEE